MGTILKPLRAYWEMGRKAKEEGKLKYDCPGNLTHGQRAWWQLGWESIE